MNLVVGATGMVGMEICRLMAESGKPIKALVRASSEPASCKAIYAIASRSNPPATA